MTTSDASRLDRLNTLRDTLSASIAECESMRDLASLSREYRAVMAEIDQLRPAEKKGDAVDEIAQRRAARRSGATKGEARAKSSGERLGGRG